MKTYTKKEIVEIISTQIKNKELKFDERLPTERELMDQYNVSRTTIRNVIADLELQRLVYRVPDTGVFVQKEIISKTNRISGFTQLITESNRTPRTVVLRLEKVIPEDIVLEVMQLKEDTEVYVLERARYVDDEPFLYENVYINPSVVEGLDEFDLEKHSLHKIFNEHYNIKLNYKKENVSAVTIDGKISDFLYQTTTAYALKVEGYSVDFNETVIEYGVSYYNSKKFSYESVLVNIES